MNDKIETQGKTVEEAINEALLRLGARRDEVDVTVLDEPKSGFLGFLGGKPARVEVSRKGGRRRGPRQGGGNQAHEFGEGSGDGNRRRRSSRSRRPRNDRREKDEGETRQAEGRSRQEHQNDKDNRRNENRQDGDGKSRGRRRRRPRKPRTDGVEAQNQSQNQSQNRNQNENRANRREDQGRGRRERPAAAKVGAAGAKKADQPTEAVKDPRRTRSRNQRGRRRGENGLASDVGRSAEIVAAEVAPAEVIPTETMNKVEADGNTIQPETSRQRPRHEDGGREDGGRNNRGRGTRRRDSRRSDPRRTEAGPGEASEPRTENSQEDVVIETIAKGIPATKYAQATRDVSAEDINSAIEKLTGGVLVRAGFPARCEVKDGDYRQVRITTGDDGAAVLIGRHGNTIDSLEHLVERMISTAHGDRVRMNLDVNNYRRRRNDNLIDRVDEAVEQVRSTGKAYHVEPMNARERRLVHLAVEQYEGMRTFTMDGQRGRHVVIALDNTEDEGQEMPAETGADPVEEDQN